MDLVISVLAMIVAMFLSIGTIFGVYMVFKRSFLLGILCLVVPISFTAVGSFKLLFKKDLLEKL